MKICIVGPGSELAKRFVSEYHSGNGIKNQFFEMDCNYQSYKFGTNNLYKDKFNYAVTFPASVQNSKLVDMTTEAWDLVIEDTLNSVAKSLIHILKRMEDGGAIVVIGSIVGSIGGYGCSNYSAAKSGLVGLVKSVSQEILDRKIRINLLELGYVDAGLGARLEDKLKSRILQTIPMKRFATVEEVIQSIHFLLTYTYMTGNILTVAGGL